MTIVFFRGKRLHGYSCNRNHFLCLLDFGLQCESKSSPPPDGGELDCKSEGKYYFQGLS